MRTMSKILALALLASGAMVTTNAAYAEISYNIGYASEYYFRGVKQKNSSASAGIDFE